MSHSGIRRIALGVAAALGFALAAPAAAGLYSFTNIADSQGPIGTSFGFTTALNHSGVVAFQASLDAGGQAIYKGSGGVLTTVADTGAASPFSDFGMIGLGGFSHLDLNDAGGVAFYAQLKDPGREGIFVGSGGPTTTIADTMAGSPFNQLFTPSINSAGTVAFIGSLVQGGGGLFTGTGGAATPLAEGAQPPPMINDPGAVAYWFIDGLEGGIRIVSGGTTSTVVHSATGPIFFFTGSHGFNDAGLVAFSAVLDSGLAVIQSGSGGPLATVADSSGAFAQFRDVALNDTGGIAFWGELDGGGVGIFAGADPIADAVVQVGDPLFGDTVAFVDMFTRGLNDRGQIAFRYLLDDGRFGIARADPVSVPEPGTLALFASALAGLAVLRRRRA